MPRVPRALLALAAAAALAAARLSGGAALDARLDEGAADASATLADSSVGELPVINFIIVRHALSCANIEKYFKFAKDDGVKSKVAKQMDPMLSWHGIQTCDAAKDGLAAFIRNHFGDKNFAVWSSVLLRAQETAFYQLAGPANRPISVVPYVGESCKGAGSYCNENNALSLQDQDDAHVRRNPGVKTRLARGYDYRRNREDTSDGAAPANAAVSDSDKFLKWLTKARLDKFADKGKVGEEYNVVLFTHSNFIKSTFGAVKAEISNNAAFFVKLGGGSNVKQMSSGREKFKIAKGVNEKADAKDIMKNLKKAQEKVALATEAAGGNPNARGIFGGQTAQQKLDAAKQDLKAAEDAFRSVDLERFGIFNLKLNPDARIMVAPYLFNGDQQTSTSGCPRLTKCGYNKLCTGSLSFGNGHACTYDNGGDTVPRSPDAAALVVAVPRPEIVAPGRRASGGNGNRANNRGDLLGNDENANNRARSVGAEGAEADLEIAARRLAHVPRVEIDPTQGAFGAYRFSVSPPQNMCAGYAPLRPKAENERALHPAFQTFEDPDAKSPEERFQPMWRPLA